MKDTCDINRVTGERLQIWHAFMDRLYEIDKQKEREPNIKRSLSQELDEKDHFS